MYYGNEYTEQNWRDDSDAREMAELQAELDHMQDYAMEAGVRSYMFTNAAGIPPQPMALAAVAIGDDDVFGKVAA